MTHVFSSSRHSILLSCDARVFLKIYIVAIRINIVSKFAHYAAPTSSFLPPIFQESLPARIEDIIRRGGLLSKKSRRSECVMGSETERREKEVELILRSLRGVQ